MNAICRTFFFLTLPFFFGCATAIQQNVNFTPKYWDDNSSKIGVYVSEIPASNGHLQGANCLLCLAVASGINSGLSSHMKTQSTEDLNSLKEQLISALEEKGAQVKSIETPIDFKKLSKNSASKTPNATKYNFSPVGEEYNVEKILVVNLLTLGTMRDFANYVPVGDPYAIFNAIMYVVNTNTNVYEFYEPINITQYSETPWKEEGFPGLTNAFYTALDLGKKNIIDLETTQAQPVASTD